MLQFPAYEECNWKTRYSELNLCQVHDKCNHKIFSPYYTYLSSRTNTFAAACKTKTVIEKLNSVVMMPRLFQFINKEVNNTKTTAKNKPGPMKCLIGEKSSTHCS